MDKELKLSKYHKRIVKETEKNVSEFIAQVIPSTFVNKKNGTLTVKDGDNILYLFTKEIINVDNLLFRLKISYFMGEYDITPQLVGIKDTLNHKLCLNDYEIVSNIKFVDELSNELKRKLNKHVPVQKSSCA